MLWGHLKAMGEQVRELPRRMHPHCMAKLDSLGSDVTRWLTILRSTSIANHEEVQHRIFLLPRYLAVWRSYGRRDGPDSETASTFRTAFPLVANGHQISQQLSVEYTTLKHPQLGEFLTHLAGPDDMVCDNARVYWRTTLTQSVP
jgi:hypothetical protein